MIKRTWFAGFFLIAFALALAHNAIPHAHPEATNEKQLSHSHPGDSKSRGHQHRSDGHSHDESDRDLPVFSHFSNADYLGSPVFQFNANEKQLIELLQPQGSLFLVPSALQKPLLFPKARDMPSGRPRSSESLRAPPFLS